MSEQRISLIRYYKLLPVAVYVCDQYDKLVEYTLTAKLPRRNCDQILMTSP